jgi:MFS family permease
VRSLRPRSELWRDGDFLRFWSAQTASQLGTQISILALPLVAVLTLDASAFQVALLTVLEWLPWLVLALPAGVWVDRLPRRPVMIVADLGRAAALASLPVVHAFGGLTMWQVYAVAFAVGVQTVFFDVAYQAYLPSLVGHEALVDGNSKLELSRAAAQVAGPGLGGVLVATVTAPFAVAADALSFLVSGGLLLRIRRREETVAPHGQPNMRRELAEGLRYVFGHRYWRAFVASTFCFNFFGNISWSILVVYAVRELRMSAGVLGLTLTLASLGFVVGAALGPRILQRLGPGPAILGAAILGGVPLVLIPFASASSAVPVVASAIGLSGLGVVVYNISGISLMQTLTPQRLLGRFTASRRMIVFGCVPLGALVGGALASQIGLRPTIFVGTVLSAFSFVPIALSPLRSLRTMPSGPEDDVDAAAFAARMEAAASA